MSPTPKRRGWVGFPKLIKKKMRLLLQILSNEFWDKSSGRKNQVKGECSKVLHISYQRSFLFPSLFSLLFSLKFLSLAHISYCLTLRRVSERREMKIRPRGILSGVPIRIPFGQLKWKGEGVGFLGGCSLSDEYQWAWSRVPPKKEEGKQPLPPPSPPKKRAFLSHPFCFSPWK